MEKCVAMGVPPGPLLARLKNGENVTLSTGKVVRKADVCEPDVPGPVFMVLECPTERHLTALLDNPLVKCHQNAGATSGTEDFMEVVVHMTPDNVLRSKRYGYF